MSASQSRWESSAPIRYPDPNIVVLDPRFRSLIAQELGLAATQVKALILGEHGDSMVPVWSSASIAGLPLEKWPGFTPKVGAEVFQRAKTSGAEMGL